MPIYEYYCPKCADKFEELRPVSRADEAVACAKGHRGATRLLSMFATTSKGGGGAANTAMGGGCGCGSGGCGCGH